MTSENTTLRRVQTPTDDDDCGSGGHGSGNGLQVESVLGTVASPVSPSGKREPSPTRRKHNYLDNLWVKSGCVTVNYQFAILDCCTRLVDTMFDSVSWWMRFDPLFDTETFRSAHGGAQGRPIDQSPFRKTRWVQSLHSSLQYFIKALVRPRPRQTWRTQAPTPDTAS